MKTLARARDREEVLARLNALRPDARPRWGRMSAHQMVCHLADACRMATGERPARRVPGLAERTIVKWFALYVPIPWPHGMPTTSELDQQRAGTAPIDFASDVANLERLVDAIGVRAGGADWPRHPVFGRMSEAGWLRWAYLHMDHHLRQFGA
jgi:hypothetical protein